MTTLETRTADPLAPVREALLARARAEADRLVAGAREEAAEMLARAQDEADAIRAEARAQGEADAEHVLVLARTRARRQARAVVLRAQSEVYEELRRRVGESVHELRNDPSYPALLDRLEARAHEVLGPDAQVTKPPEGGVVAVCRGRRFVFTLADLADQALATSTADLEELWSR